MRWQTALCALCVGMTLLVGHGCGGDSSNGVTEVHAFGRTNTGTRCPPGTTAAYRDGALLVCNSCTSNADCIPVQRCETNCGPGCESDTGGCCLVTECIGFE